jgi:hypothetical protein
MCARLSTNLDVDELLVVVHRPGELHACWCVCVGWLVGVVGGCDGGCDGWLVVGVGVMVCCLVVLVGWCGCYGWLVGGWVCLVIVVWLV